MIASAINPLDDVGASLYRTIQSQPPIRLARKGTMATTAVVPVTVEDIARAWRYLDHEFTPRTDDAGHRIIPDTQWAEGFAYGRSAGDSDDVAIARHVFAQLTPGQWRDLVQLGERMRREDGAL